MKKKIDLKVRDNNSQLTSIVNSNSDPEPTDSNIFTPKFIYIGNIIVPQNFTDNEVIERQLKGIEDIYLDDFIVHAGGYNDYCKSIITMILRTPTGTPCREFKEQFEK